MTGENTVENEPPDWGRWSFYVAVVEVALNLAIWISSR